MDCVKCSCCLGSSRSVLLSQSPGALSSLSRTQKHKQTIGTHAHTQALTHTQNTHVWSNVTQSELLECSEKGEQPQSAAQTLTHNPLSLRLLLC